MNIRSVESATGLTRANIRYYESVGLVEPVRQQNGYRDYSKEDVETLKRVKLLRKLNVPIEEIIKLQNDEISLLSVIEKRIDQLKIENQNIYNQQRICQTIKKDGITYHEMCADAYLLLWDKQESTSVRDEWLKRIDQNPPVYCIWRRIFARILDLLLYTCLISFLLCMVFHPLAEGTMHVLMVSLLFSWLPMLWLEPIFLHYFGTTPCKWLLGLQVRNIDGNRLTIDEAKNRTKQVLYYCVFTSKYRFSERFHNAENGDIPWESVDETIADEFEWKHFWSAIAVVGISALFGYLLVLNAQFPVHRGDLTKAQLAKNYNRYAGIDSQLKMDEDCQWREIYVPEGTYVFYINGKMPDPQLVISEVGGQVQEIYFEVHSSQEMGHGYQTLVQNLMYAFVGAQRGCTLSEMKQINEVIDLFRPRSFSVEINGVQIDYTISHGGYASGHLLSYVDVTFRMRKIN